MRNKVTKDGSKAQEDWVGVFQWQKNKGPALVCTWRDIDEAALADAIHAVTAAGNAVILGVTSDGGAYSVTVLAGDTKLRHYPHGKAECEDLLASLKEYFTN